MVHVTTLGGALLQPVIAYRRFGKELGGWYSVTACMWVLITTVLLLNHIACAINQKQCSLEEKSGKILTLGLHVYSSLVFWIKINMKSLSKDTTLLLMAQDQFSQYVG